MSNISFNNRESRLLTTSQLEMHSRPSSASYGESIIAGYVAGVCGTLVGHPLDSIKVLLQTNNFGSLTFNKSCQSKHETVMATKNLPKSNITTPCASIFTSKSPPSSRSLRALFAGISGPMMTIGLTQALNFSVYDTTRRILYQQQRNTEGYHDPNDYLYSDTISNVFIASSWSGVVISFFTSPLNIIKTKQQIMVTSFREALQETLLLNNSTKMTFSRMRTGIKNLFFTGFTPHLFCEGFGRGLYYTSYEFFKRKLIALRCEQIKTRENDANKGKDFVFSMQSLISLPERALCAALAGMCQWAVIYPADLLRCRMYANSIPSTTSDKLNHAPKVSATLDIIKSIYKTEGGMAGFFRGFWVTVFRAGPVAAIVLPVYDVTLEYLLRYS